MTFELSSNPPEYRPVVVVHPSKELALTQKHSIPLASAVCVLLEGLQTLLQHKDGKTALLMHPDGKMILSDLRRTLDERFGPDEPTNA